MSLNSNNVGSASRLRSRASGCLFFIGFGAVWFFCGLFQTHHASRTMIAAAAVVCAALLGLTALLFRRSRELPSTSARTSDELRARLMFRAVNIIQWVSIGTAVAILNLLAMPEYIVPAIAIIVGLHLFPLAGAFHHRQHYITGSLLIGWSLGCLALLPRERVAGIAAVGTGSVLLASAAATLLKNFGTGMPVKARA